MGFLVNVTVYEEAFQINCCQTQQKEDFMANTQHDPIIDDLKKQKSVGNFKPECQKAEGELFF